jgi:hypothetical protein
VVLLLGQTSKILYQELTVEAGSYLSFEFYGTGANALLSLMGWNNSDESDANTIATGAMIDNGLTVLTVPSTVSRYRFIGFRVIALATTKVKAVSANLYPEARWKNLFYGSVYTYSTNYQQQYPGVRQLLCAYAYAYLVDNNAIHVTRGGVNKKTAEDSENVTERTISGKSQEAYSEAIRLEREFMEWMSVESGNYPEYNWGTPSKQGSFSFFNASRQVKYSFAPDYWNYENPHN